MELYERDTCSFIVKVWVERDNEQTANSFWRGHITHVFTGQRQYFEELTNIVRFIEPYLTEICKPAGLHIKEATESPKCSQGEA